MSQRILQIERRTMLVAPNLDVTIGNTTVTLNGIGRRVSGPSVGNACAQTCTTKYKAANTPKYLFLIDAFFSNSPQNYNLFLKYH